MSPILESITTIALAIVGVAVIAVIVSKNAQTAQVIQAGASAFGNSLGVALTPVTGNKMTIDTSYPGNHSLFAGA